MTAPRAKIAAFKRSEALAYRVPQACEISGYGKSKFYELIGEGKIKVKKDGNVTLILRDDLEAYLKSLPYSERPTRP